MAKSLDPETPFTIDEADMETDATASTDGGEEYCFYVAKNWFAKKNFPIYPQNGYKPIFLSDLSDSFWYEFNRDVQHYQKYFNYNSWYYKLWTIVPTAWFLVMILPDLLWYYDIVFHGVGILCGVVLALAFSMDTYLQRRLMGKKIQPMYDLLINTYKERFRLHGYTVDFRLEPTVLDGMNSYIQFKRIPVGVTVDVVPSESLHTGFYLDEDFLGEKPYVLEMTSHVSPPRFLQGVDMDTWRSFSRDLEDRTKTPKKYFLSYTIFMALLIGSFAFAILYAVIVFSAVRHWTLITLFPLYGLADLLRSFRRRHFVENVLVHTMKDLLKEYEEDFEKVGYKAVFELEYIFNYLCVNTYIAFYKSDGAYAAPQKVNA